jgi:cell division septum initiation protein DivIVA
MADLVSDPVPDPPDLDPGTLASAGFNRARKGFEPAEVRAMLGRAADALRAWKERDDRLIARLEDLERKLEQSQELDEQRITAVLGEETARIVAAAREAASEIRTKAEEQAAQLIAESEASASAKAAALTDEATALRDEAQRLRDEAAAAAEAIRTEAQEHADWVRAEASAEHDSLLAAAKTVLDEKTAEAEAVASSIREAAQIELDNARAEGERLREEAREAAAAEVERARAEGRAMVEEARQLRRQMLQDLAERRRTARRQIEAARAGRDRIIEALGAAGDRVTQVIAELHGADDQAQRAADAAAAAVDDDIDAVVAELETGMTLGGLPLLAEDAPAAGATTAPVEIDLSDGSTSGASTVEPGTAEPVSDEPASDEAASTEAASTEDVADETAEVAGASGAEPDTAGPADSGPAVAAAAGATVDVVVVEQVEVEQVAVGVAQAESAAQAEPEPTSEAGDGGGDEPTGGSDEEADDGGERSPGATVHDLFERIRAERRRDEELEAGVDADGADALDEDLDDLDDEDGEAGEASVSALAPVVVLEQPGEASEPAPAVATDTGTATDSGTATETVAVGTAGEPSPEPIAAAAGEASSGPAADTSAASAVVDAVAASSALDRRDALLTPIEKSLARALKRLVSDEQNEVLDRLRRIRRGMPDLDALLPQGDDVATFTDALRSEFTAAAEAGAAFWRTEAGDDSAAGGSGVDGEVIEGGLELRVVELLGLRRAHVQRALEHAADEGVELAELADHVRAAYREWRTRSVPELAGDLAAAGFALGEQAAAGPGASWCWMVDNGGLPCSDAEDNALAGAVRCGDAFPTGDVVPPAHSGCRCILVPPPR